MQQKKTITNRSLKLNLLVNVIRHSSGNMGMHWPLRIIVCSVIPKIYAENHHITSSLKTVIFC